MTSRPDRISRSLREVVLTVGAVLGVLALLVAVGVAAFGLRPLVFRSGSMEPTIGTGALALARNVDADSLRVGQIVSVPTEGGDRVSHRITYVEHQPDHSAILKLRGDANEEDDQQVYRVDHADKVLFSVPLLGHVVAWLSGSTGRFLLGIYAAFLLMVLFRRRPDKDRSQADHDPGAAREPDPSRVATSGIGRGSTGAGTIGTSALVALTLGAGLVVASAATPTWAHFSETVAVTAQSPTISTYTVPTTTLSCSKVGSTTSFSWTAVAGATDYTISFAGGSPAKAPVTQTLTTYVDSAPRTGRVATVVVNRSFGSVTWSSVASNGRTETANNGSCS